MVDPQTAPLLWTSHFMIWSEYPMNTSYVWVSLLVAFSCQLRPLVGAEYDWELVYYDGAGGQLLGLEDVAFADGVFVAVGDTNFVSLNGTDWTPVASFRPNLSRVTYGNGKFVAVGGAYVHYFGDQTGTNI